MAQPKHPEELLPAKHPPHRQALQAPEKHPDEADVLKLGTPAPVTCLPRTHRRCLSGGCFAGREKCPAEASPAKRHLDREMFPVGKLPREGTSAHRSQYAVPSWRMFCRKGRLPRGGTSAHRTQYAVPPWRMFCRKGRLPREGTSGSVSAERHLDRDFPVGKVPRRATPAAEGTRFIVKGQRTAT